MAENLPWRLQNCSYATLPALRRCENEFPHEGAKKLHKVQG
jgi:hypothetical protein